MDVRARMPQKEFELHRWMNKGCKDDQLVRSSHFYAISLVGFETKPGKIKIIFQHGSLSF